jgi:SAM-dependent methyltransferase
MKAQPMELLPDRVKKLWQAAERNELTSEQCMAEQERLLEEYRGTWRQALLTASEVDLEHSHLRELGEYLNVSDPAEVRRRCLNAVAAIRDGWHEQVKATDRRSIEQFYDANQAMLYELMWWHTLGEDSSPLAYVTALEFARQHGCRSYLDFGSGVGSGAILFARHGFQIALADVSTALLEFARWRLERRDLPARFIDLKTCSLPDGAFDFVAAMDVFEHLVDPVRTVQELSQAMRPGGILFGRFHADTDEDRPCHVVADFGPTFDRLKQLGFSEVWHDEWLWGHQAFQKQTSQQMKP